MARARQTKVTIALTPADKARLVEYARARSTTPSAVARDALRSYLENQHRLEASEWEGKLERRVKRMEDRLAGLMAKLTRASTQTLYFTMTPFLKGGWPEDPLPQGAFNQVWMESRQFAADWLKKAQAVQEAPADETDETADST